MQAVNRGRNFNLIFSVLILVTAVLIILRLFLNPNNQPANNSDINLSQTSSSSSSSLGANVNNGETKPTDLFTQNYIADKSTIQEQEDDQHRTVYNPNLSGIQNVLPIITTIYEIKWNTKGYVDVVLKSSDAAIYAERFLSKFQLSLTHANVKVTSK